MSDSGSDQESDTCSESVSQGTPMLIVGLGFQCWVNFSSSKGVHLDFGAQIRSGQECGLVLEINGPENHNVSCWFDFIIPVCFALFK